MDPVTVYSEISCLFSKILPFFLINEGQEYCSLQDIIEVIMYIIDIY